jgi:hypothetical protein
MSDTVAWSPRHRDQTRVADVPGAAGDMVGGHEVHWAWRAEDGKVLWVDFAIFEVETVFEDGSRRYESLSTGAEASMVADAVPVATGFVKWDGCTQWSFPHGAHADSRAELECLHAAVAAARRVAISEILTADDYGEYDDEEADPITSVDGMLIYPPATRRP